MPAANAKLKSVRYQSIVSIDSHLIVCTKCGIANRCGVGRSLSEVPCGNCGSLLGFAEAVNITDKVFLKLQARDQEPFVLKVWAPWSELCKNMALTYNSAAQSFDGDIRFLKLNYQKYKAVSDQLGVREIPALFLYNHGVLVTQMSGALSEKSLIEWVKAGLKS